MCWDVVFQSLALVNQLKLINNLKRPSLGHIQTEASSRCFFFKIDGVCLKCLLGIIFNIFFGYKHAYIKMYSFILGVKTIEVQVGLDL